MIQPKSITTRDGSASTTRPMHYIVCKVIRPLRYVWDHGILCACLGAVVFALNIFSVKLATTQQAIPLLQIVLFRSLGSMILTWIAAAFTLPSSRHGLLGHPDHRFTLAMRGCLGCASMTVYYVGLKLLPLAEAVTLFFLNPAVTALLAWLFANERMGWRGIVGCVFSLAGLVLVTRPPFIFGGADTEWGPQKMIGSACMLLSALLAGLGFLTVRHVGHAEPSLVICFWFHLVSFFSAAFPLALQWPAPPVAVGWYTGSLLALVAATSFGGWVLLTRALQLESAAKATSANYSQVLYGYILDVAFFHTPLSWWAVAGSCLVAIGVLSTTQDAVSTPEAPNLDDQLEEVVLVEASEDQGQAEGGQGQYVPRGFQGPTEGEQRLGPSQESLVPAVHRDTDSSKLNCLPEVANTPQGCPEGSTQLQKTAGNWPTVGTPSPEAESACK